MTQEQKDLLLKDLCARLSYGVKVNDDIQGDFTLIGLTKERVFTTCEVEGCHNDFPIENIKPYLFPLSSMTDELWDKEFMGCSITEFTRDSFKYSCETLEFSNYNPDLSSMVRFINQLIKNHFDIYGLIPMGLANDATGLNIY